MFEYGKKKKKKKHTANTNIRIVRIYVFLEGIFKRHF